MKRCRVCGETKPLNEFYRHPGMADGHLNICIECKKLYAMAHYSKNADKIRRYDKRRNKSEHRREHLRNNSKKWNEKYPERYKAHYTLRNAVRDRRIIKPEVCEICGVKDRLHGHHQDYNKPLDVLWICPKCHARITKDDMYLKF